MKSIYPDPHTILEKYFEKNSISYKYILIHSECVANKALEIASHNKKLNLDLEFIRVGAMLHDIGVCMVNAPAIGCFGQLPYIAHTYSGREIMEKEGFPNIALICERHIGVGLSKLDIVSHKLPLPARDMIPLSNEEKIICLADKFYSKSKETLRTAKPIALIRDEIEKFGQSKRLMLDSMIEDFYSYGALLEIDYAEEKRVVKINYSNYPKIWLL